MGGEGRGGEGDRGREVGLIYSCRVCNSLVASQTVKLLTCGQGRLEAVRFGSSGHSRSDCWRLQ